VELLLRLVKFYKKKKKKLKSRPKGGKGNENETPGFDVEFIPNGQR
jgi:hypothetical protein